ncbi:MAG TPA: glycosyl transferase [Verrucomicrobiales bacterium]|nr:glycosyl transferase [Verrucomicrobiales bacterium]
MADFHQGGSVATLHNLTNRPLEELEAELIGFSKKRPMGLLLPSLFSELETEAMPKILDEVKKVPYLSQIVIGLDRANDAQYREALDFFGELPQHHRVLWNDGPRLRALDAELQEQGLAPEEEGKGRNVWYCLGYMLATDKVEAIALHDCDIVTYNRSLLARLIYPMANPQFSYQFAKGYYPRIAEGNLNGRVTRLLITPLLQSLQQVCGDSDYLSYLDGFRYPLAGEFSFRKGVIPDIRMPSDWGLEMGTLSEMFRNYSNNKLCQVDIAEVYDHKHQDISVDDRAKGLSKMSIDICKLIYRKMAVMGAGFRKEVFRTLKASYFRNALDFVERYKNDAIINGLDLDVHKEEEAVELFAENIIAAGKNFLSSPHEKPFIPSWSRVRSAIPDIYERLIEAVEEDQKEFFRK